MLLVSVALILSFLMYQIPPILKLISSTVLMHLQRSLSTYHINFYSGYRKVFTIIHISKIIIITIIDRVARRMVKLTLVIIGGYHCYQFRTKFIQYSSSRLSPYINEIIGDHQCGFRRNSSTTDQIFCISQILEKNGITMRQYISYS
jgi:hypothetical protein